MDKADDFVQAKNALQDTQMSDMTHNTSISEQQNRSINYQVQHEPKKQSFLSKLKSQKELTYTIDDIIGLQTVEGYWNDS